MVDKLMYIHKDDTHNYPSVDYNYVWNVWNLMIQPFEIESF